MTVATQNELLHSVFENPQRRKLNEDGAITLRRRSLPSCPPPSRRCLADEPPPLSFFGFAHHFWCAGLDSDDSSFKGEVKFDHLPHRSNHGRQYEPCQDQNLLRKKEGGRATPPSVLHVGIFDNVTEEEQTIATSDDSAKKDHGAPSTKNNLKRKEERENRDVEFSCSNYCSIKKCVSLGSMYLDTSIPPKAEPASPSVCLRQHATIAGSHRRRLSTSSSFSSLGFLDDDDDDLSFLCSLMDDEEGSQYYKKEDRGFYDENEEQEEEASLCWSLSSSMDPFSAQDSIQMLRQKYYDADHDDPRP